MLLIGVGEIETVARGFGIAVRDAAEALHRGFALGPTRVLLSAGAPHEIRDQTDDRTARLPPIGQGHTGFAPRLHETDPRSIVAAPGAIDDLLT
jgi:hypothetical protein